MAKPKKQVELEEKLIDAIADLQRTRADFENYRNRVEGEKQSVREAGQTSAILKLLPVIDNIERAIGHMPENLKDDKWAQGVAGLSKNLDKSLEGLNLKRIDAKAGTPFNPDLHEAIQFDEEAEELCDQIALINDGKILKIGTVDELKKAYKVKTLEEVYLKATGDKQETPV